MELKQKVPASKAAEVLGAVALLLWRVWDIALASLWRDWVTVLALYWIFSVFAEGKKVWSSVTVLLMAALMLLYGWGQFPHLLALLGFSG
jgi:hypothetical protein